MERGYAATSPRMITAKAKVHLAAVNYHFDSKDALIREVFERRLGPLNSARIAHLDGFESGARGRPLTTGRIMEAIVTPALQVNKDPLGAGAAAAGRAQARSVAAQDRQCFRPQGCLKTIHGFAILGARK